MKTIVLITLLLAIASMNAQMALKLFPPFPTGYVVAKGDTIRIPLDLYVDLRGAKFTLTGLDDTKHVIPKVVPDKKIDNPVDPKFSGCDQALPLGLSGEILFVCQEKFLFKVKIDQKARDIQSFTTVDLKKVGATTPPAENQDCYDTLVWGDTAYIVCVIKSDYTKFIIYSVKISTMTIDKDIEVTAGIKVSAQALPRLVRFTYGTGSTEKALLGIYDSAPTQDPSTNLVAGDIPFLTVLIDSTNPFILSAGKLINLASSPLMNEPTLKGKLRLMANPLKGQFTAIVGALAATAAEKNPVYILRYNWNDSGDLEAVTQATAADPANKIKALKYITSKIADNPEWDGLQFGGMINGGSNGVYTTTVFDRVNGYTLEWTHSTGVIVVTEKAIIKVDCGEWNSSSSALTSWVGRVLPVFSMSPTNTYDAVVEYRDINNTNNIKGFATWGRDGYGCSAFTTPSITEQAIVPMDGEYLIGTRANFMTFYKINQNTMLEIDTKALAKGVMNLKIDANIPRYTQATANFNFEIVDDSRDYGSIKLPTKSIKIYNDAIMNLPFISRNFEINAPNFTVTATGGATVKPYYVVSQSNDVAVTPAAGYVVKMIHTVDHDSQLVIMTKANSPDMFNIVTGTWGADGKFTPVVSAANNSLSAAGFFIFKSFKLGTNICLLLKLVANAEKKLEIICYEDKKDGAVKLTQRSITAGYEINEVAVIETASRVDLLMVGGKTVAKSYATFIIQFTVTQDTTTQNIDTSGIQVLEIETNSPRIMGYSPMDILPDYVTNTAGKVLVTIKMQKESSVPLLVKYALTRTLGSTTFTMEYLQAISAPMKGVVFCINRKDIIFYNPRNKMIWAKRWEISATNDSLGRAIYETIPDYSDFVYGLDAYNVQIIHQFNCIAHKSMFQVLASTTDKKKVLITFRGGESSNVGRRIHSIIPLDDSVTSIQHGTSAKDIVAISSGLGTDGKLKSNIMMVYGDGPIIQVTTTAATEAAFKVTIKVDNGKKTVEETVDFAAEKPTLRATIAANKKLDLASKAIALEDFTTINGPVMDVQVTGGQPGVTVTQRSTLNKNFMDGATIPNKIFVEGDYMATLYTGTKVILYGDPDISETGKTAPHSYPELTGVYQDIAMVKYNKESEAMVVTKEWKNLAYTYTLHHLFKDATQVYKIATYPLWTTNQDYSEMQIGSIGENNLALALLSKKELLTSTITLIAFNKATSGSAAFTLGEVVSLNHPDGGSISTFSLASNGKSRVVLLTNSLGSLGLLGYTWDGITKEVKLFALPNEFSFTATGNRKVNIERIACWPLEALKLECYVDCEGVTDYVFDVTVNELATVSSDFVTSIVLKNTITLPPGYSVAKVDRAGSVYGFLMKKIIPLTPPTPTPARILQGKKIEKFTDCDQFIGLYDPKRSTFLYTAIMCSEFNKLANVDFALEMLGGKVFTFFTKAAPVTPVRVLQAGAKVSSNTIAPIQLNIEDASKIDTTKVNFKFVGLNGDADPELKTIPLSDFQNGAPPAPEAGGSFWTWFFIILLIILVIGGGVYGYMWWQGQQSSSSSTSDGGYSKSNAKANTSSGDLEDTRL
jgi:hypothetical protein